MKTESNKQSKIERIISHRDKSVKRNKEKKENERIFQLQMKKY